MKPELIISAVLTAIVMLLIFCCRPANAGPYIDVGMGVPLNPSRGYIPDQYGILGVGYRQYIAGVVTLDIGAHHRSLTDSEVGQCPHKDCMGDNAVEVKLSLEWK